jgi:hypothetical protein
MSSYALLASNVLPPYAGDPILGIRQLYADVSSGALSCACHRDQVVSPVSAQRDEERIAMRTRMELGSWGQLGTVQDK